MQPETLSRLIEKVLAGETRAFDKLITEFRDTVFGLAYQRLGNLSYAEEIAQEAFIKAWRNLASLKDKLKFPAWLYAITTNLCMEHLRQNPRMVSLNSSNDYNQPDFILRNNNNQHDSTDKIMQAISQLTELQREVITLRFQNGLNGEEIARHLGESHDAIRAALYRAIKTLRTRLKPFSCTEETKNGMR